MTAVTRGALRDFGGVLLNPTQDHINDLRPPGDPLISLIPPKALVVVDAGLGTIIDDKVMFWHNGGNVGFRSLYVGDPVSGNGMAAMTNGHKGEEVCNALRQRGLFQS